MVSCEAIPTENLVAIEYSNCCITTLQIVVIHSNAAISEIKCKNSAKMFLIICKNMHKCLKTELFRHKNILITQDKISQSYTLFSKARVCEPFEDADSILLNCVTSSRPHPRQ